MGRPPKDVPEEIKKQAREDERIRNHIEGKFGESSALGGFPDLEQLANPEGQGKRRFTLGHIMAKLPHTALTSISISFLVMNLSTLLLRLLWGFLCLFFRITTFFDVLINKVDELFVSLQRKLIFSSVRLYPS